MNQGDAGEGEGGGCPPASVPCDDLTVAMTGIDPASFTVTRLRASLPSSALAADLLLEASPSQAPVPSFHVTTQYSIPNYDPCGSTSNGATQSSGPSACTTTAKPGTRYADVIVLLVSVVGLAFGGRRRRRA